MLNQVSWIKRPQGQDAQADRSLTEKVSAIIERVKTEGDTALRAFSQQFDNVVPTHFEVSEQEIAEALQGMDAQTRRDSEFAINQVRRFAQAQLATMQPLEVETLPGVHPGADGGLLRAGWALPDPLCAGDVDCPCDGGGLRTDHRLSAAGSASDDDRGLPSGGRAPHFQGRWRAGHCGHGLGNGEHSIGGQNRWARQRLR